MKTITAQPNQSIPDIVHMAYGTLEALMPFCRANNVSPTDVPVVGTTYNMPEVVDQTSVPADNDVLLYLEQNSITIGTAAIPPPPPLSMTLLLKPDMEVISTEPTATSVLGYYDYEIRGTAEFVNVHELQPVYPGENKMRHSSLTNILSGLAPLTDVPFSAGLMSTKSIKYHTHWASSMGLVYRFFWGNTDAATKTITYKDIENNEAYISPVFILTYAFFAPQECLVYLLGDITIELLSSTSTAIKVRLTRTHPEFEGWQFSFGGGPHILTVTSQEWLNDAVSGTPDPVDPANANKTILTLSAGKYTIGVKTNYKWTDASTPPTGLPTPSSHRTMVVEIA